MRITEVHRTGKSELCAAVDGQITLLVPIKVLRRSARKHITRPLSNSDPHTADIKLTPLQMMLVRGHHCLSLLESGAVVELKDFAKRDNIDPSLVSRFLNFTALAPKVVEAILNDALPVTVTVLDVAIDPALCWSEQIERAHLHSVALQDRIGISTSLSSRP